LSPLAWPDPAGRIVGDVFEIAETQLVGLDIFEGVAQGYYRRYRTPQDYLLYVAAKNPKPKLWSVPNGDWLSYVRHLHSAGRDK
jgi:gamma-glutamylcyclotransferase (GGCT)/AIG2-like uncharacterized protein YtfP